MRRMLIGALVALGLATGISEPALSQNKPDVKKVLVAYYSYSGNTKEVAEKIAQATGADLFEIKTEGTYPEAYQLMTEQAKQEIETGYRPKLITQIDSIGQYEVIFIGSPNWWGTITPQVSSFLETYDLSGKTVIPFITHGSGGIQNTVKDLTAQCKGCLVSASPWVNYGNRTQGISAWVKELNLMK